MGRSCGTCVDSLVPLGCWIAYAKVPRRSISVAAIPDSEAMPRSHPGCLRNRWQDDSIYGEKSDPWTLEELDDAFVTIAKQHMPDFRFCMFIDGLDKYEGRPDDIIDKFQHLAEAESVKLCLASRPWTPFRELSPAGSVMAHFCSKSIQSLISSAS